MARKNSRRSRTLRKGPARKKLSKKKLASKKLASKKLGRKMPARRRLAQRTLTRRTPKLARPTGSEWAVPHKLADTDQQIETFRHHVSEQCVSIASSIDSIPPETIPPQMRDRWLRELRQAAVALVPVIERLAPVPTTEA